MSLTSEGTEMVMPVSPMQGGGYPVYVGGGSQGGSNGGGWDNGNGW